MFAENRYTEYLHLHGLGVEMAEALAEYWHLRIRQEWGFAGEDGPTLTGSSAAVPRRAILVRVPRVSESGGQRYRGRPPRGLRIGVEVSEGFQLHPEQSTLALICHHPQAKYFVA